MNRDLFVFILVVLLTAFAYWFTRFDPDAENARMLEQIHRAAE